MVSMVSQHQLLELHYNKLTQQTMVPKMQPGDEALKTVITETKLSRAFFSPQNIQDIQATLRYQVHKDTKQIIGNQSEYDLLIVMRSIYLQYSGNNEEDIKGEIAYLNQEVLKYCIPVVTSAVYQHLQFLKDVKKLPGTEYMDRPVLMSSTGTKMMAQSKRFL